MRIHINSFNSRYPVFFPTIPRMEVRIGERNRFAFRNIMAYFPKFPCHKSPIPGSTSCKFIGESLCDVFDVARMTENSPIITDFKNARAIEKQLWTEPILYADGLDGIYYDNGRTFYDEEALFTS